MSVQFQNDVQALIHQLTGALGAAQAILAKGNFYKNNFQMSSRNVDYINHRQTDTQEEIEEYEKVIGHLEFIHNGGKITIGDFHYLNKLSYMQDFMQTHGENVIVTRRNTL